MCSCTVVIAKWPSAVSIHILGCLKRESVGSGKATGLRFEVLTVVTEDFCLFECDATSW